MQKTYTFGEGLGQAVHHRVIASVASWRDAELDDLGEPQQTLGQRLRVAAVTAPNDHAVLKYLALSD